MKISVVVPTLNEEKYIEKTLRSLKNQDYEKNFEILVPDSRSEDRTRAIAKKFARVVDVPKRGFSAGRNAGARVAKGEVILFLDADTIASPNLVSEIAKTFSDKKVVGATAPIFPMSQDLRDYLIFWFFNRWVQRKIKKGKAEAAGTCLAVRRKAFFEAGEFDETEGSLEDIEFCSRLRKLGKFVWMQDAFVLTSPRRIEKLGLYGTIKKYAGNYFRVRLGLKGREFEVVR